MLLSIGQALLPSTALSESTDVTDVTNEEFTHLEHSSHVGKRAQGGRSNCPISERKLTSHRCAQGYRRGAS